MPNANMQRQPDRPTWIEIDGDALINNLQQIRSIIGPRPQLCAVVKANAYGHDAALVASIAARNGADRFAVAATSEGFALRHAGIDAPILVLGYTPARLASTAITHRLALAVYDLENALALNDAARSAGATLTVHVKINTGMNRLGVNAAEGLGFFTALQGMSNLVVEGIFTHFASSDLLDKASAYAQFSAFELLLDELSRAGMRPPIAHAANSAAILTMPETHLDMVRAGITIYGLDPDVDETPLPDGFQPVMSWKTEVAQVRRLSPGDGVSYGHEFVADREMVAAVIPVGYADGFPRRPLTWESVLIRGRSAAILGRVCMDQAIVDVTPIVDDSGAMAVGEEVILIGRQGDAELSADEAGRRTCTINYDVLSRILARVPRV